MYNTTSTAPMQTTRENGALCELRRFYMKVLTLNKVVWF